MKTRNKVVEFKADENDARAVPYLCNGDVVRGIVFRFTEDGRAIVTAVVGCHFYKFYKHEADLTIVER